MIRSGIADASMRPDLDARLAVLSILGMCNSVINWPVGDQEIEVQHIAGEFARLVANGVTARAASPRKRS